MVGRLPTDNPRLVRMYSNLYYLKEEPLMKFMVVREEAIRRSRQGRMINNSMFPIVVEMESDSTGEEIVRKACSTISDGYVGMHNYVVIPMESALRVSFKPRQSYDVEVSVY